MPALIPKEVEIQRLKKIWLIVIAMGSIAASVEVDNFVDGSLHQTSIRDSAFTPAHWWLYSHFVALPLGWGSVAIYDRKVPILRGPNNSMNTGTKDDHLRLSCNHVHDWCKRNVALLVC